MKFVMKRDSPKVPTALHGPIRITYEPNEKTSMTVFCLGNQVACHGLCNKIHDRQMETRLQALITSVDDTPFRKVKILW
jgi:hypothetical protein